MGIAQKVSRDFSDAVRARGRSYFAKGRVAVTAAAPNEVVARVRGTAKYRVRLRLRGGKLHVSCSCPYYVPTGEPCKHLWATILMADARALLPAPQGRLLKLISDPPRKPKSLNDLHPGPGPGPGPEHAPAPGPPGRTTRRGRKDRQGRPAGWEKDPSGAPRAKPVNRGTKRLLVYVLDVPATLSQNQVVIDLARRQRRPTGDWGPLKPWWHAPGSPHAKYDPEDRDLLSLLEEAAALTPVPAPSPARPRLPVPRAPNAHERARDSRRGRSWP